MNFELHKLSYGYRDIFEVHAELSKNHKQLPVTLELMDTNNPGSRRGWAVSGSLVRY
jgi:hypothetical protein